MPLSLSLTVTTQSLYAITVDEVLEACAPCWTGGGGSRDPLVCDTICVYIVLDLAPLKLAAFSGVVLTPTELLTTVISHWMFCMPFAVSWICWRASLITGCWSTLPVSTMVDAVKLWNILCRRQIAVLITAKPRILSITEDILYSFLNRECAL